MRSRFLRGLLCVGVVTAVLHCALGSTTTVYDSTGFESPKFTTGNLTGKDNGLWIESGGANAGSATVQTSNAFTGIQGVTVNRTNSSTNGGDKQYWPSLNPVTPTATQNIITVSWDMKVLATRATRVTTGPFFGIEAYDPNVNLIAGLGVDASTGEILFDDPSLGGGFNNTNTDALVTLGAWNHFQLSMNFTTHSVDIYVNGLLQQQAPAFDSPGVTQFSDADLSAIGTNTEPPIQTGTAYFDNYVVLNTSPVPEPAAVGLLALGTARLLFRRSARR